jgi:hypothetical protein
MGSCQTSPEGHIYEEELKKEESLMDLLDDPKIHTTIIGL